MELEESAEEILETLWIRAEEDGKDSVPLNELGGEDARRPVGQLLQAGYVALSSGHVWLTEKGYPEAENVVRRHRLAERLLADVLGGRLVHERACKFEHLLDEGLDESICTLLGHPRVCPHGKPIPTGRCCREGQSQAQKLISPLVELTPGQQGKIAYIHSRESERLWQLINMGVLPGTSIRLIQSFPSFVFQIEQSQFAIDGEVASAIYVRIGGQGSAADVEAGESKESLRSRLRRLLKRNRAR